MIAPLDRAAAVLVAYQTRSYARSGSSTALPWAGPTRLNGGPRAAKAAPCFLPIADAVFAGRALAASRCP